MTSTIVGYLMPNPFLHILNIYKHILLITFLNEHELIFLFAYI